jgi:hypothetical protein
MLGEDQVRHAIAGSGGLDELVAKLAAALGADVDAELEPYRRAGDGTAVTWLHQVG